MSRIANRPLVKAREPNRFSDLGQAFAGILLLIIPAFLYASQRADMRESRRQTGDLETALLQLQQERKLLELELQTELDPRTLERKARTIAGLRQPEDGQVEHMPRAGDGMPSGGYIATVATDGHP